MQILSVKTEQKMVRVISKNIISFTLGKDKVTLSMEQDAKEPKFFSDLFRLKLILGSAIKGEPRENVEVEYDCSKERMLEIIRSTIALSYSTRKKELTFQ